MNFVLSIFDMNFVLPPLVEMTEVEKDMPTGTDFYTGKMCRRRTHENIHI